jgi:mRNA-degrading endonuclease RelE of RelBE toxin-antitoxin system
VKYEIIFGEGWERFFSFLDNSVKKNILRRIGRMAEMPPGRHLRFGSGFFVEEIGQYRILYAVDGQTKIIYFVGTHKDYEKFIGLRK